MIIELREFHWMVMVNAPYDHVISVLLHFRTPPPIVIDDSLWKNAAESFTVALTLTLVRKCNSAHRLIHRYQLICLEISEV